MRFSSRQLTAEALERRDLLAADVGCAVGDPPADAPVQAAVQAGPQQPAGPQYQAGDGANQQQCEQQHCQAQLQVAQQSETGLQAQVQRQVQQRLATPTPPSSPAGPGAQNQGSGQNGNGPANCDDPVGAGPQADQLREQSRDRQQDGSGPQNGSGPTGPGAQIGGAQGGDAAQVQVRQRQRLEEPYRPVRRAGYCLTQEPLSTEEVDSLQHMREEEKLARDVYLTFAAQYDVPIFSRIAASETQHMEAVGNLIEKYGVTDPVTNETIGVFTNETFATLYAEFTKLGAVSLEAALQVGAQIEQLDIADLQGDLASIVQHADIAQVYGNLLAASQRHLTAFEAQLEA
jgi:hypothetical protein